MTRDRFLMAVLVAALLILAAKTVYDNRDGPIKDALADATAEAYFAERPGPFCTFEGVWHDWERDETITLGCLEVKGNIREGNYSSAMGPRATSNFSMTGTYDIDGDSCMRISGKDREGKDVKFTTLISAKTRSIRRRRSSSMKGSRKVSVWKRKE